ncbi:hypothetical protein P3T76_013818 [Phytophthora citrophthora]|uniref:Uncharacterized protein n=1 Tax=Phytophthora citrophthora TaxID=4793 RepID=A0AAD9LBY7_9STRA|nr:hypothetical protein P3T76_013818 [Phytophthora citrophthora]
MENGAWNEGAQVVLKKNIGRFVTLLPLTQPVKELEFGAKLVGHISVIPSGEKLKQITKFVEAKEVKPVIDTVYSKTHWMRMRS